MIKIIVLRADEGKLYTNGKIEGVIAWVDESEVGQWYQIPAGSKKEEKKESIYDKFKYDLDLEEEDIEE